MTTINISLPENLKVQAQSLVDKGFYSSFSDLVRDALRRIVVKDKYERWADEAEDDVRKGKALVFKNPAEIKKYFDSI